MIFIDIDGVISDFERWVYSVDQTFDDWTDSKRLYQLMKDNYRTCYLTARATNQYDYFKMLYDQNREDTFLLTSRGNFWDNDEQVRVVTENKLEWCMKHGFEASDVIITSSADEKLKYCKPGSVLYDDRPATCKNWIKAGGIAFLVNNPARPL